MEDKYIIIIIIITIIIIVVIIIITAGIHHLLSSINILLSCSQTPQNQNRKFHILSENASPTEHQTHILNDLQRCAAEHSPTSHPYFPPLAECIITDCK
jgi:hypothetical protein